MTTQNEDAESLVGEEEAKKLAEQEKELIGKSEALVIKAEEETQPEEVSEPIEEVDESISARKDVNPKEGKKKYGDVTFADEKNKKYPIDTEEHIRAAWNYINHEKNAAKYSSDEVAQIKRKIIAAWKAKIDKEGPPSASSKSDYDNWLRIEKDGFSERARCLEGAFELFFDFLDFLRQLLNFLCVS